MGRPRKRARQANERPAAVTQPTSRSTRNSTEAAVLDAVLRNTSVTNAHQDDQSSQELPSAQPATINLSQGTPSTQPAPMNLSQQATSAQPAPMNLNRQEPSSAQHAPLNPGPAAQAVQVPKRDVPVGESGSSNSNNVTNPVGVAGLKPLASVCSPLGEGVSQALREKIGRGEFVDLGLLLENWGEYTDPEQLARNVQLSLDSGGHPVFKPIVPKAKIDSLAKWTSAFLVYSSIFIDFHPQRAQEMLKYIQIIRSAAIRFGSIGWRLYDSHFRMRQQRNPQNLWSTIDSELWFLFVVSNSSRRGLATPQLQAQRFQAASAGKAPAYNFSQRAQVFPAQSQQRATGGGMGKSPGLFQQGASVCFDFNSAKGCNRKVCKFAHKCAECGRQNHGSTSCWSKPGVQSQKGGVTKK